MDTYLDAAARSFADAKEAKTVELIGLHLRGKIGVSIRKPRWMPGRMYRYLMRTIVVVETPVRVTTT